MEVPDPEQPKTLVVERDQSEGFNPNKTTHVRNLVAFWFIGLCHNLSYYMITYSANIILQDYGDETKQGPIVKGKRDCILKSLEPIDMADFLPTFIIKIIVTWLLPCHLHINMILAFLLTAASCALVAFSSAYWQAVMGVVLAALSSGIGEVTTLGYTAFYDKDVVSTFSSGTGGASFLSSLFYAWYLKTETKLNPRIVVCSAMVVVILEVLMFWVLLVHPMKFNLFLNLDKEAASKSVRKKRRQKKSQRWNLLETFHQKNKAVPSLFKYMWPMFFIFVFRYLINKGYFKLAYYNVCWLPAKDQYQWLVVNFQAAVFISKSSVNFFPCPKVWSLAIFQAVMFTIAYIDAFQYIIPRFGMLTLLVFLEGLVGGAGYVNTFYRIRQEVPAKNRVFGMGFVNTTDSSSYLLASLMAVLLYNEVCKVPYGRNDPICTKI